MDRVDWLELLADHPAFCTLPETEQSSRLSRNLLSAHRGDLYAWNEREGALICLNLKQLHEEEEKNFCTILCSCVPTTPISRIVINNTGQYVALLSDDNVWIAHLPPIEKKHFKENSEIGTKSFPIGGRFFQGVSKATYIRQAKWHPDSPADIHLTILTSDNTIRIFNILNPSSPEQRIPLGYEESTLSTSSSSLPWKASYALPDSDDDVIDFDFGLVENVPIYSGFMKTSEMEPIHSLFILKENGDVHVMYPRVNHAPAKCPVFLSDPLPVHPPPTSGDDAQDNYEIEACSIICLKSDPCVIGIGLSNGTVSHSLIIRQDEDDGDGDEEETFPLKKCRFLFEMIDLNLTADLEENELRLHPDPVFPSRYHIQHRLGIHVVTVCWLENLKEFTEEGSVDLLSQQIPSSRVEEMLSVKALPDMEALKVNGLCVVADRSLGGVLLFCLTSKPECLALQLGSPFVGTSVTQKRRRVDIERSPMRQLERKDFLYHITGLLQRSKPLLLRSGDEGGVSQQKLFQILIERTQLFRSELSKLEQAKDEISKRAILLKRQKEHQLTELERMEEMKEVVMETKDELDRKSNQCQGRQEELMKRARSVLQILERQQNVESIAEKKFAESLKSIQKRMEAMEDKLKQVKVKLNHRSKEKSRDEVVALSSTQEKRIRQILHENGELLSETSNQLKRLKTDSGL